MEFHYFMLQYFHYFYHLIDGSCWVVNSVILPSFLPPQNRWKLSTRLWESSHDTVAGVFSLQREEETILSHAKCTHSSLVASNYVFYRIRCWSKRNPNIFKLLVEQQHDQLDKMPSKFQQPFSFVCRHTTLLTNLNQPRYGIHLWGMVLQREPLRQLGTTMLTLCAMTIREFFLMTDDNPHHPEDFVRNHATGVWISRNQCLPKSHHSDCRSMNNWMNKQELQRKSYR